MKDVHSIVKAFLKRNKYDGLCSDECGCVIDDLAPCDGCYGMVFDCVPGYKIIKGEHSRCDDCEWRTTGECYDYCLTPEK